MSNRTLSQRMLERSCQSLAGGVSSNVRAGKLPPPLFFEYGHGSSICDVDGNKYIDYVLGQGPLILGHGPAVVLEAVSKAISDGQLYAGQCEMEITVSEKLQKLIPCAELVRYSLSGSEIVQAALRLARAYTGREQVIKFEGHYHGWFDNVLISVHPPLELAGPHEAPHPVPDSVGQVKSALGDVIVLPWNDLDVFEQTMRKRGSDIAAVIMEPIMCNTGCILPKEGYLEGVQRACRENGVVLILDEIITGFRVGLNSAQGYFGVTPDLATFGKAMAGGFPVSCLAGKRGLMKLIADGTVNHSGTFNSNVMAMAAASATLSVLDSADVYEHLYRLGTQLKTGLQDIMDGAGIQVHIEGPGPMINLAFTDGQPIYDYRSFLQHSDVGKCQRFADLVLKKGVRFIPRGMWYLSTAHTAQDIEFTLDAVASVVHEI
jgi:glutamate-1-semialdehyde 2,1-aminomutase